MNIRMIGTIMTLTAIAACASMTSTTLGCSYQNLNLTLDLNKMHLVPKSAKCITAGSTVKMKITVTGNDLQIGAGDVVITPKPGNPAWLNGSNNADPDEIVFTVPGTVTSGEQFKYLINVAGVGILDPIVRVVD
jgi:hypothetical protein